MMVYQQSATDCGDACFRMVCSYYLISDAGKIDNNPLSMRELKKRALSVNLIPKVYQASAEALKNLQLPLIAHWNHQHFIVIEKIARGRFYIKDPAFGQLALSQQQFEICYCNIVMSFDASVQSSQTNNGIKDQAHDLTLLRQWFEEINIISLILVIVSCLLMFSLLFWLATNIDIKLGLESFSQARLVIMLLMMSVLSLITSINQYLVKQVNYKFVYKLFLDFMKVSRTNFLLESHIELFDQFGGMVFSIILGALMLLICLLVSLIDLRLFAALNIVMLVWLCIFIKFSRIIQYFRYMAQMVTDLIITSSGKQTVMLFEHRLKLRSELHRLELLNDFSVKLLNLVLMGLIVFLVVWGERDPTLPWLSMAFLFYLRHVFFAGMGYVFSGISSWRLLAKNLSRYKFCGRHGE